MLRELKPSQILKEIAAFVNIKIINFLRNNKNMSYLHMFIDTLHYNATVLNSKKSNIFVKVGMPAASPSIFVTDAIFYHF